jgi:hypothetical protein
MSQATQTSPIDEIEDLPIEGFYRPSESLTTRIADRIESLESEAIKGIRIKDKSDLQEANEDYSLNIGDIPMNSSNPDSEVTIQQRLLAEELDSCLADSSESNEATQGEKLTIQKVIRVGMADALGLDETDHLLKELSSEFQHWIDGCGVFTAGWGEIISTKDGCMYLRAFTEAEDDILDPDLSFTRSYRSAETTKPATNFFARVAAKLGVG